MVTFVACLRALASSKDVDAEVAAVSTSDGRGGARR